MLRDKLYKRASRNWPSTSAETPQLANGNGCFVMLIVFGTTNGDPTRGFSFQGLGEIMPGSRLLTPRQRGTLRGGANLCHQRIVQLVIQGQEVLDHLGWVTDFQ